MKIARNTLCSCGSNKKYKRCCMLRNERKPHETIKHFFGEQWVNEELSKARIDGYHNLNPMNLAQMRLHPLIKAIVDTQIKLSRRNTESGFPLGEAELFQDLLHINLTLLEPILDIEDVRRRLRDADEFPKIQYELFIAAGYVRMGYKVKFIPRSTTKRTGEFYIFGEDEKSLLIECKQKDLTSVRIQKLGSWWDELQHPLTQKIIDSGKSYGILIHIPDSAERADISQLIKESAALIALDFQGKCKLISDKYTLIFEKIQDEHVESNFTRDTDVGVSRALINVKTGERTGVVRLSGRFPDDFIDEKISSAMSSIKQAYGQLEEDKPNVVYVDIGVASMMPTEAKEIMAKLPKKVEEKLQKDYSKISAVVLTDIALLKHSEMMAMRAAQAVIYNPKAKHLTQPTFRIYGDEKEGKSILEDLNDILDKH